MNPTCGNGCDCFVRPADFQGRWEAHCKAAAGRAQSNGYPAAQATDEARDAYLLRRLGELERALAEVRTIAERADAKTRDTQDPR